MGDLGQGVKPAVAVKYRHMMPEDTIIWRRFVELGEWLPERVWYDVRVGSGVAVDSGQPEWMARMAEYSTRKRIDVVGRYGADWWVIEAKPGAGVVALGQVVYYREAFAAEYGTSGRVVGVVVTDVADLDVVGVMDLYGIVVFEVGREGVA